MFLLAVAHGARGLKSYVDQFGKKGKVADELAPALTDFGWAHESIADLAGMNGNKLSRGARRMSEFMGNLNAKLTDDHTRRAAWVATMKPHVAAMRKAHPGMSWEDAAKTLWQDERFADSVTQRVLDDMIDFSDLSEFERKVIKRAIPFYAWIKGISKRTGRMIADDPVQAAIGANIGAVGNQAVVDEYGNVPAFMGSLVPLRGDTAVTTAGLNPFVTPADVLGMVTGAFVPGQGVKGTQNPLSQLGPVWKAPLEALTGKDFFYGNDLDLKGEERSLAQRLVSQSVNAFPQARLYDEYQQSREDDPAFTPLYDPSFRNAMLAYLGIPVREVNRAEAQKRGSE
jgi:hypothetical protein